ncbi:DNA-directed RNA polymerase subunit beta [Hydrogenivirga sp. 128-5-R1-1]|uniref:DNA-directed RNA polymerase subunit beta n=1 Tax=Hydrogenivirga sp. 128-5-R1-1 TaxID=392423 RepID=UPI00015F320E|nr:DNA-directed RNA polymerase subunit beta [Hydrogenivirga sp. 128-5-R1-1]EDP74462.1 RNA polymerase beta subunit [Hydrogenivirga sp. 128-5-R1-1]
MKNVALPRKFFGRRDEIIEPPYLLSVPKSSFENFIQLKKAPHERENIGLEYILRTSFPFVDPDGNIHMEYLGYEIGDWECNACGYKPESDFLAGWGVDCPKCGGKLVYKEKYTPDECRIKGLTYSAPLRVMFKLKVKSKEDGKERETPPKKVYFGEIPLMTDWGSFIINGSERVIVNQLIRSTGVFFEEKEEKQKDATITRIIYRASIIPDKGSRIEFELSGTTDTFHARVDRKKISGIAILRAWGFETAYEILSNFYEGVRKLTLQKGALIDTETGEEYRPEDLEHHYIFAILRYRAKLEDSDKEKEFIEERYIEEWEGLELLLKDERIKVEAVTILPNENAVKSPYAKIVVDTLANETTPREPDRMSVVKVPSEFTLKDYGYMEIYKKLRLVETMTMEIENLIERARSYFEVFFGHITRYDLSKVGRVKINAKVHKLPKTLKPADVDLLDKLPPVALAEDVGKYKEGTRLTKEVLKDIFKSKKVKEVKIKDYTEEEARFILPVDLINILKYLIDLRFRRERKDDIAHLGNRRVRSVGELLENQVRTGIAKMEKVFRDRVAVINPEDPNIRPQDLINPRYVTNSITEFLKGGQLSQYLDNANPLSALTHKRRLSALGPGGLTRESAKFEIRDVHPSHYGRICPIETPEGQNIGLVTSMTVYAQVNEYGFLITPYRKVENGTVTNDIDYLAAYEEEDFVIAQSTPTDEKGKILTERVLARHKNDIRIVKPEQVNYIDVSPRQVISVSASLIPFLEHDDANRALMGSNMQRQAVPLIFTQAPLIGTGMEKKVARDSHSVLTAKRGGVVEEVNSARIVVRVNPEEIDPNDPLDFGIDIYDLKKFQRTNQNTCVNQRPLVEKGQEIKAGEVIADGQSTFRGELALGKDVLVAFMPWRGYNFEDAIVISERLVKEDVFTSIHIEELEVEARETKLGEEEISRQIPGVPEKALAHLDELGIVRVGTYVKPGDILVGKVTPKGETQLTPEEKLLQAIFGEKSKDVKDSSLRCPPGVEGVVIDVQIFTRRTGERRNMLVDTVEREEMEALKEELERRKNLIIDGRNKVLKGLVLGKKIEKDVTLRKKTYKAGTKIDEKFLSSFLNFIISKPDNFFKSKKLINQITEVVNKAKTQMQMLTKIYDEKKKSLYRKGDLPPGVITLVKVYIAQKRKIKVGDKMAGRHGNKGVISVVLPVEDMPFLPDGTPVDVVLNPLGVPSRMNVGQILETHLGWAARGLGRKIGDMISQGLDRKKLTKWFKEIYAIGDITGENAKFIEEFLNSLSDDEFYALVKDYAEKGVPMATPAFEGAEEEAIKKLLKRAGLPENGKSTLYDGRTGEPFDFEVTVGYMHMLKLIHMVDDKVHARSTGPYSLVTQQPLGGRAQFGGQRLGEMEVWALEAHGAAYTLQEMLTVKSDDIEGRSKVYEAIVKGRYTYSPGIPESFRVLVRELKALSLDVRCVNGENVGCDQVEMKEEEEK